MSGNDVDRARGRDQSRDQPLATCPWRLDPSPCSTHSQASARQSRPRANTLLTSPAARGRCGMSRIRTLVVEDQPIARDRLVALPQSEPDVEVVGAADTGLDAVEAIRRLSPDLVFLDLQIPDLDGFGVISEVGHAMPLTIFVTAYDEYALRAFDVHA